MSPTEFIIIAVIGFAIFCVRIPQILKDRGFHREAANLQIFGFGTVWNGMIMLWSVLVFIALIRMSVR